MTDAPSIRRARVQDASAIAEIYRPHVEGGTASFEQIAPTADDIAARMADAGDAYPWIVAERDDRVAGYSYAGAHRSRYGYRWSVDTAIYVAGTSVGEGVGRSLYGALLGILTRQNFAMAFAGITLPNDASRGLHRTMGFEPVARYPCVGYKDGVWMDTEWWARPLAERTVPPKDILPVPSDL
ncbi:MAG: N-acetyltransferase family protein [Pseudomonadota bacterium]